MKFPFMIQECFTSCWQYRNAQNKVEWINNFQQLLPDIKKELLWTSSTSKPDFSASVAPHFDAYLETVLLQKKESFFCGSSKLLKKCLLLKWAAQSLKLYGSILLLKWVIKNYSGCRIWKTTTHIIRQCFPLQSYDFIVQHETCYNPCMSGACFCPYNWSTVLVCGRAEVWKEINSQQKLTLVTKEMS